MHSYLGRVAFLFREGKRIHKPKNVDPKVQIKYPHKIGCTFVEKIGYLDPHIFLNKKIEYI